MTALTHRIWWKWCCVTSEPGPWKVIQIPPGPLGMLSVRGIMWRVSGPLWDHHHPREARNKACIWSQNQLQLSEWMILYCYWILKLAFNSQRVTQMSSILHQISWKKCTSIQSVTLWDASHVLFFSQFSQSREALICWMPHAFFPRKPSLWVSWEFTAWPVHLSLPSSLFSDELALSLPGLSFCLQVLHHLWFHFPQCLILHTSLNRETDSEDSSSLLSHVIHGLFLRVFSATRQLLFSHLPSPKLPLGEPHKSMWEKADLLMCQVPARIIPWCRQAGPSGTEGGAHRAALGGAVDGQVRGMWC